MFSKQLKKELYILGLTTILLGNCFFVTSCNKSHELSTKQIVNSNEDKIKDTAKTSEIVETIYSSKSTKSFSAEINPNIELLSGALSQTSWVKERGPKGEGNEYYKELKKYFSNYKDQKAIEILEKFTKSGFTYDAPPNFILSLGSIPDLKMEADYSNYLVDRAKGKKNLEELRLALIELNKVSNFADFFQKHKSVYEKLLEDTLSDFNSDKVIEWLENYYGWKSDEFHLVLAPAMFPGGGYAATIKKSDGTSVVYQVIRENGSSNTKVEFQNGSSLEALALHEWGHSYVNPTLEENKNLISNYKLEKLFEPVKDKMKAQAYSSVEVFLNEQVLRAVTAMGIKEFYGSDSFNKEIEYNNAKGFYLTEFTTIQLEEYTQNRSKYPTFKQFAPYLLEQYNKNMEELLKKAK